MTDYIDRQAAIAYAISGRIRTLPTNEDGENWIRTAEVRQSLLNVPSAEVEPVTRCKDCIYYRQEIDMCDEPYSTAHNVVHEDDYCSRAERKEKE